jgi:phytoene synthase
VLGEALGYGSGNGDGVRQGRIRGACASAGRVAVGTRERAHGVRAQSSVTTEPSGRSFLSAEQKVFEVVAKQAAMVDEQQRRSGIPLQDVRPDLTAGGAAELLDEAYVRCGEVCAEYAKTFYLGKLPPSPLP